MKKLLLIKLSVVFVFLSFFFFLVITVLACLGYSFGNEIVQSTSVEVRKQSYLENNDLYIANYKSLINKYLLDYGYVSMERVIWYLQITNNFADPNTLSIEKWEDAYIRNLNITEKQMIPTKDMCRMVSSSSFYPTIGGGSFTSPYLPTQDFVNLCDEDYITEKNLIYTTSYLNLPYVFPLKKDTVLSFTSMVNEKRNVDLGLSESEQAKVNFHSGWDIGANAETNVYSICDGTIYSVTFTQNENIPFTQQSEPKNTTGNIIKIQCDGTKDIVTYAHLYPNSATSKMIVGNAVNKGQLIAKVGTTGQSTGNHLHLGLDTDSGIRLDAFYFINFQENSLYSE